MKLLSCLRTALCLLGLLAMPAAAAYPEKPINMIIAFTAGGSSDVQARIMQKYWNKYAPQPWVFVYKPGAGGIIGFTEIAKARPDGYTIGGLNVPHIILQPLAQNAQVTPDSFKYICQVVNDPQCIAVRKDSPYQSTSEIIAAARKNPGKIRVGLVGPLSGHHLMFLDYGKNSENCPDDYVYAYGMDYNWRDSFTNQVIDPVDLYLARVHKDHVMDRTRWEFFTGTGTDGQPGWSGDITQRRAVLHDDRKVYTNMSPAYTGANNMTVISQGSIVYNKPLDRYIYTSWTEYTFEFYESPTPYGPFKLFLSKDFGGYPWTGDKHGGYACTIPSKFISEDGREMWVFSATFNGGAQQYRFTGRKLVVDPYDPEGASNAKAEDNLAVKNATPYTRCNRYGKEAVLYDGDKTTAEDSWTGEMKKEDYWGYTYSDYLTFNAVEYTTGNVDDKGGFFTDVRVQVRRGLEWVDVDGLHVPPEYTCNAEVKPYTTYTFTFDEIDGDGIRVVGTPGGTMAYTGIAELAVFYR